MSSLQTAFPQVTRCCRGSVGVAALFLILTASVSAGEVYVDGNCGDNAKAGITPNCADPDGPKATIQAGIDVTANGDVVVVADGAYTGTGNKELDFGGRLITVRSANGAANCIIDCEDDGSGFVFQNSESEEARVQGFTITKASTGGIRTLGSSASPEPTITQCTFRKNIGSGINAAGGITVTQCRFVANQAGPPVDGGGILSRRGTGTVVVADTDFLDNTAAALEGSGGGAYSWLPATVTRCSFEGNIAGYGGGLALGNGGIVTNSIFVRNTVTVFDDRGISVGPAIYSNTQSTEVANCTFVQNVDTGRRRGTPALQSCPIASSEPTGGAVMVFGTITNCIFWQNIPHAIGEHCNTTGQNLGVTFSLVPEGPYAGDYFGEGIISGDPRLVALRGNLTLSPNSPCIDAGNNEGVPTGTVVDIEGNPRFMDDPDSPDTGAGTAPIVDMGAYEFGSLNPPLVNADLDNDGDIDLFDYALFQQAFMSLGGPMPAARAEVVEFEGDAEGWKSAAPGWEGYAFDLDFPGCASNTGCLVCSGGSQTCGGCSVHYPTTLASISGGIVTVRPEFQGSFCTIFDDAPSRQSDGRISGGSATLVMNLYPPISAFYTYYARMTVGETATMALFNAGGGLAGCRT